MSADISESAAKEIQKDWLRLVEFGNKALKFNAEIGKVLDEQPITKQPGGRESLKAAKRLSDVYDFRFYTMGPVYTHCNVPFDIMGEYRALMEANKTPYEGPRMVLNFNSPLFTGLGAWDNILEGIWADEPGKTGGPMSQLVQFMTSQRIRQADSGTYWGVTYKEIVIADPMAVDRKEYDPVDPSKRVVVGVFLPSGNRYSLGLGAVTAYPPVPFQRYSPDPDMVREGGIMLNPTLK